MDENYSGDTVRVEDDRVVFPKNNFSVAYSGPQMNVSDKYYVSPGGKTIHFAYEDRRPIVVKFDKGFLLQELLDACLAVGVTYLPSSVVYDASDNGSEVTLSLSSKGQHKELIAQKVIAADGVNTRVSEALGLNKDRQLLATALCVVYFMEGVEVFENTAMKTYFGRAYQGLAPIMVGPSIHGKNICYVICTGNQQYQPRAIFENVTTKGTLAWAFKNARIVKEVGCTLKTFNAMPVPWKGNALAIGD
ncbi:MAG: NAD(P)/FAD-dependent oxidoreductase, partial [Deltaproteobacteria bacterium]|nr:NAD(P)/FAD-dependent oxidoreductase [Deltaproteobacteria bacterium]